MRQAPSRRKVESEQHWQECRLRRGMTSAVHTGMRRRLHDRELCDHAVLLLRAHAAYPR